MTTISSWNNIPVGILDIILEKLSNKDYKNCSMTCHSWRSSAQRPLFERFSTGNNQQTYELAKVLSNNKSDLSPGNFVRFLLFHSLSEEFDYKLLDKIFPFVERINFLDKQYPKARQLILEGTFPNLKMIPHYDKHDKDYLELVLARKDTITELIASNSHLDIFDKLHLFSKLELLVILFRQWGRTAYLEQILPKDLPQPKSIEFVLDPGSKLYLGTTPHSATNIQPLQRIEYIKIRGIECLFIGEESYLYFMKKFPNPKVLVSDPDVYRFFDESNYTVPSLACLFQFLVYLFNIEKKSVVRQIITDQHTTEIVAKFFNYALNQKSSDYNNVETRLNILFYVVEEGDRADQYSQGRVANIDVFNSLSGTTKLCKVGVVYKVIAYRNVSPYNNLFKKLGSVSIECLTIGNENAKDIEEGVCLELDTVFDHLKMLKKLRICSLESIDCSTKNETVPSNVENLVFKNCQLNCEIFSVISTRCSNLKKIEIAFCSFTIDEENNSNVRDKDRVISFVMQSTSLEELYFLVNMEKNTEEYYDDTEEYYDNIEHNRTFIRLKTATSKPRYCILFLSNDETHCVVPEDGHAEYAKSLEDKGCMVYDVYCKAVTKLIVQAKSNEKATLEEEFN